MNRQEMERILRFGLQTLSAHGCGDNGCRIKKPSGPGTNGECRCAGRLADLIECVEQGKSFSDWKPYPT